MKKLMVVAAAAALAGVAQAIPTTGEQAYNMTLTVKTTVAQRGAYSDLLGRCDWDPEAVQAPAYRKQATRKLAGLIWGCWCDTINAPAWGDYSGYVFWNVTEKFQYDDLDGTVFNWTDGFDWDKQIDRFFKNGKKSEGIWALKLAYLDGEEQSQAEYNLTGAGFGTAAGSILSETKSAIYVPSMNGYFVGTRSYTCKESGHCGEQDVVGVITWPLCLCGDPAEKTVAYGSWKIKFNNSVATKFAKTGVIQNSYNFPKYVTVFGQEQEEAE